MGGVFGGQALFNAIAGETSGEDGVTDEHADLLVALDAIEEAQWACPTMYGELMACPWCEASRDSHLQSCKPALLLRKYGRKVKIQGDQ